MGMKIGRYCSLHDYAVNIHSPVHALRDIDLVVHGCHIHRRDEIARLEPAVAELPLESEIGLLKDHHHAYERIDNIEIAFLVSDNAPNHVELARTASVHAEAPDLLVGGDDVCPERHGDGEEEITLPIDG